MEELNSKGLRIDLPGDPFIIIWFTRKLMMELDPESNRHSIMRMKCCKTLIETDIELTKNMITGEF